MLDERLSFRVHDKIPYGSWVAYKQLTNLFPGATVTTNRKEPGLWDSLSVYDENQALIIISPKFQADRTEMKNLVSFAENGNDVFISTMDLPYDVTDMLRCQVSSPARFFQFFGQMLESDTLAVSLASPPFPDSTTYEYPGKELDGYFSSYDSTTSLVLGYNNFRRPDFIHLKAGKGNFYVHLAPMAFTNYFLLHKNNLRYYEKAISLISPGTRKIVWDEYYLNKKSDDNSPDKKSWLSILLNTEIKTGTGQSPDGAKPFKAAFWLLLLLLLVYVLMEMRRKQKFIPVIKKPGNDSLDFVKTIGRLYHDKGDHRDLCKKMSAYFLEHVRNRYKLPTTDLNEEFIKNLHNKTAIDEGDIRGIVSFIKELEHRVTISDKQMVTFHSQLESFYKKE